MSEQRTAHVLIASDASFEFETPPTIYTDKDQAVFEFLKLEGWLVMNFPYEPVQLKHSEKQWQLWVTSVDGHENESLTLLFDVPVVES